MTDLYQPIIGADDVRAAYKAHLVAWTPAYLAEVARQAGIAPADQPRFESFEIRSDNVLDNFAQLPALSVQCDEIEPIGSHADGSIDVRANVIVRVYAGATTHEESTQLVARMAKAVRAAVLQHRTIGGLALTTVWVSEVYAEPRPDERAEAFAGGAAIIFDSTVCDVTDHTAGPRTPPADPLATPDDVPTADTVTVTVDHMEP